MYVCSEPQADESDIRNVIFESNQLNKNNYFSGSIENITYDKVYLYVVGYNMNAECIYSETIDMNMPKEWAISKNPIIDFDENKVSISSDSIFSLSIFTSIISFVPFTFTVTIEDFPSNISLSIFFFS